MNYYIFLSYNFRMEDNPIFSLILDPKNIYIFYIKPKNNYFRKNKLLDEAWNNLAIELLNIGINCYEYDDSNNNLSFFIQKIKEGKNNKILIDKPTLLFPPIDREYKICKAFFNYNLKNNKILLTNSISFFKKKYNTDNIIFDNDNIKIYKIKKNTILQDSEKIWNNILKSNIISQYEEKRDFLDQEYTSKLSSYINSGQISIRKIWLETIETYGHNTSVEKFLSELGWRDFAYHQFHFNPNMIWENLNKKINIEYKNNDILFNNWKSSNTGIKIIDAGMNQLNITGWIPNRIRMLVASYLTKNLSISWQKGAEYFLEQLIDADPVINALNWQWVAGTGTDYMPHFRIFNPIIQAKKYDPKNIYQNKWFINKETTK